MTFQFHALPADDFAPLFDLSDEELAAKNACRMTVTTTPGFPCRVSLKDAAVGETVILTNHRHQPASSPYQSSHAVYVAKGAQMADLKAGEVPEMMRSRLLSLRLFSANDMIVDGEVLEGDELGDALLRAFENEDVAYAHVHFAARGCFAGKAVRATQAA